MGALIMKSVKETLKLNNATVLVCDLFEDSEITAKLKTNVGTFDSSEFEVETVKPCFCEPITRKIVIKKSNITDAITNFSFI
jgi:hypothetical protein